MPATFLPSLSLPAQSHVIDNPDLESELSLLHAYGPSLPLPLIHRVASLFADLRRMSEEGQLSYPYSTREAVGVVKHVEAYPHDGLLGAVDNVFAFDGDQPELAAQLAAVMRRHGIPACVGGEREEVGVELAPEEQLPASEPIEKWCAARSRQPDDTPTYPYHLHYGLSAGCFSKFLPPFRPHTLSLRPSVPPSLLLPLSLPPSLPPLLIPPSLHPFISPSYLSPSFLSSLSPSHPVIASFPPTATISSPGGKITNHRAVHKLLGNS